MPSCCFSSLSHFVCIKQNVSFYIGAVKRNKKRIVDCSFVLLRVYFHTYGSFILSRWEGFLVFCTRKWSEGIQLWNCGWEENNILMIMLSIPVTFNQSPKSKIGWDTRWNYLELKMRFYGSERGKAHNVRWHEKDDNVVGWIVQLVSLWHFLVHLGSDEKRMRNRVMFRIDRNIC